MTEAEGRWEALRDELIAVQAETKSLEYLVVLGRKR